MKSLKILSAVSLIALVSGCTSDLVDSVYDDPPTLKAAEMARARGDVPQAIHDYRVVLQQKGNCEKGYVGLGMSLLDANAVDEAKRTFEQGLGYFSKSPALHSGMGGYYLIVNQPENALRSYDRALGYNPRYARALNGRGIASDLLGNHEEAQANYRGAIELDPGNISYQSNLALSMVLSGNENDAIRTLERLAHSPKSTPRVRQNLALAYGLVGDIKMAKKVGRIDLSPEIVRNNVAYFEAVRQTKEYSGLIPKNHTTPSEEGRAWQEKDL